MASHRLVLRYLWSSFDMSNQEYRARVVETTYKGLTESFMFQTANIGWRFCCNRSIKTSCLLFQFDLWCTVFRNFVILWILLVLMPLFVYIVHGELLTDKLPTTITLYYYSMIVPSLHLLKSLTLKYFVFPWYIVLPNFLAAYTS